VQMATDGSVSLDGHDGMDMGLAADDLAIAGHFSWQRVARVGVRGDIGGRVGGHGEAVDGADQGDDGGVGDARFGGLSGEGFDEFGLANFEDMHVCSC
jgi:hypothetical protein